jgi:hypothetical protein
MKESKNEFIELDVGNLMPGDTVTIEISIVQPLESTNGAFNFELPLTYFPSYPVLSKDLTEHDKILFNFVATLKSMSGTIREISHPENFKIMN